ncbi:MAG TPA: hypothetical protein PKW33_20665 [Anaerolineaceae bacterium]|nr:hypothetical protein [Anaerolineaceae bacterium]HPN54021.1 hypothetical protein [Anaerolineaceae bacterium]
MLVDVHAFNPIDRRVTHFVGRVEEDGESAYLQSCVYFLNHLDMLLCAPWKELKPSGRSFAAGYLCHLAVDECWKKQGALLFKKLGIQSWTDFPVPGDVGLTAFDFLSKDELMDAIALDTLLAQITIPDVFTHVPGKMFVRQWEIIRNYVFMRGNPEAHFQMLELAGWSKQDIAFTRQKYHIFWEKSLTFMEQFVGVEPFLKEGIERSQQVMPRLFGHNFDHG